MPEVPIYESVNLREDHIITTTGKDFYQNGDSSLFHGPAFQKITRVLNISPTKTYSRMFLARNHSQTTRTISRKMAQSLHN